MNVKSKLFTLATLFTISVLAAGCQQLSGQQQAAPAATTTAPATTQEPAAPAAPVADAGKDANYHCHEEAPACATKCHSHAGATPGHKHTYGCLPGAPGAPKVKAKGTFKGAVKMDEASQQTLKQYQKK